MRLAILNTGLRIASLVAQRLKHLPAMRETWVWSLGQEDPLEKGMTTHSSTLAWRIPWTEEAGRCTLVCACLVTKFFLTAWTAAHQAPRSMGFSIQEYWNGLPFPPPPGSLPNPGIEPTSPASLLHFKWVLYHWATGEASWSLTANLEKVSLSRFNLLLLHSHIVHSQIPKLQISVKCSATKLIL